MLRFDFVSGSEAVCPGLKVTCRARYSEETAMKYKVLSFGEGDFLSVGEKELHFDGCADYVDTKVQITEDAPDTIPFLHGHRIPFVIEFLKEKEGYRIVFTVTLKDEKKTWQTSMKSVKLLKPGPWYMVDVVLLDGEFYFVVDGEVWIRRVHSGRYYEASYGNLEFGGSSSAGGFRLRELEMSEDIYLESDEDIKQILNDASDSNACSFGNTYLDVLEAGEEPGKYVSVEDVPELPGVTATIYKNGVFYMNAENRCVYVDYDFYVYFKRVSLSSFPLRQMILIPNTVSYVVFEDHTVFHKKGTGYFPELLNKTMERYLEKDFAEYNYWFPDPTINVMAQRLYDSKKMKHGNLRTTMFTNGLAISEVQFEGEEPYAVIIPKEFFKNNQFLVNSSFHDVPISDYSVTFDDDGIPFHYCLPLRDDHWLHYFLPWGRLLDTRTYLGPACTYGICFKERPGKENVEYCDFEGGVVVNYPELSKLVIHSGMLLRLGGVSIGEIDDGWTDNHAELVVKLSIYNENGPIVQEKKLGANDRKDASYYTFNTRDGFNEFTLTSMKGYSFLRIFIKLYDYDAASDNDYLGSFDYTLGIENGWWMDQSETYGAYSVGMTSQGKHNRHGLGNGRLDFGVGDLYDMEEMKKHWRENLGFPFVNFTGCYKFTPEEFGRLFSNVRTLTNISGRWWDLDGLALEGFLYLFIKNHMIDVGRCFGFAAVEAETYHGQGIFIPPLSKYGLKPERENDEEWMRKGNKTAGPLYYDDLVPVIGRTIVNAYMRQAGWDYLSWIWRIVNSGEIRDHFLGIQKIKETIKEEGCCIVGVVPKSLSLVTTHAVLAYKVEGDGVNTKIYIRDSNKPYDHLREQNRVADCNWISFESNKEGDEIKKVVLNHCGEKYMEYKYIMAVPYSLATRSPRVPTLFDVTCGLLSNMVFGWVEGIGNLIAASSPDGTLYDRNTESNDFTFIPIASGWFSSSGTGNALFLTKDNHTSFTLRGTEAGKARITLASASTLIEVSADLEKDEKLQIMTQNVRSIRGMRLLFARDKKGGEIDVTISKAKSADVFSHRFTHKVYVPKQKTKDFRVMIEGQKYGARMLVSGERKDGKRYMESHKMKRFVDEKTFIYRARPRKCPGAVLENTTLSVRQCANIYRTSESTIRNYCRKGIFATAFKKNSRWVIPSVEVPTMKIR